MIKTHKCTTHIISSISVLIILSCMFSFAQAPDTLWTKTFGGAQMDVGRCVQQTADNGFIVSAHTRSFGAGWHDYYLIKTNSAGDSIWSRTYGGTQNDFSRTVQQTADGGYIITGATLSYGAGNFDVYLVKTNAVGDTSWTRVYGGLYNDWGNSVLQTPDSGYIIAGSTGENTDLLLLKTTSSGNTSWAKTYGGSYLDAANCIDYTSDGGFIVAGYTESFGTGGGNKDIWLLKTDANGDTAWTKTFAVGDDDEGSWVQQTSDNGYIIASGAGNSSAHDAYIIKTNTSGAIDWSAMCGGANDDWAYSVQQTYDNGYICAGYTFSSGTDYDFYIFKLNSGGDTVWTTTLGATDPDIGVSIQQTADSGYIVTGYTQTYGAGNYDVWLVKYASETAVLEHGAQSVQPVVLISPNPFTTRTRIVCSAGTSTHTPTLEIFDITGRIVKTFSLSPECSQRSTVFWDGTGNDNVPLAAGIYFVRYLQGDIDELHKLVLMK
jgi:hypothetical protein